MTCTRKKPPADGDWPDDLHDLERDDGMEVEMMGLHEQLKPVMHKLEGKIQCGWCPDSETWRWYNWIGSDLAKDEAAAIAREALQDIVDKSRTHRVVQDIYNPGSFLVQEYIGAPDWWSDVARFPTRLAALVAAVERLVEP